MARVPGSSPSPKKASRVTKTPSSASQTGASTSVDTGRHHPGEPVRLLSPTVVKQESLQVKVPYTEEGRIFLAKLQELLQVKELPFQQTCSPKQRATDSDSGSGGTTYALELRIEQEGYPPL